MIIEIWKNIKGKRYFLKLKFLSVSFSYCSFNCSSKSIIIPIKRLSKIHDLIVRAAYTTSFKKKCLPQVE
jgi:hypothetical protein